MTSVSGSPWRQAGVRCSENTGATQRTAAPDVARRDYCDACMSRPCRMYVFASENACRMYDVRVCHRVASERPGLVGAGDAGQ